MKQKDILCYFDIKNNKDHFKRSKDKKYNLKRKANMIDMTENNQ